MICDEHMNVHTGTGNATLCTDHAADRTKLLMTSSINNSDVSRRVTESTTHMFYAAALRGLRSEQRLTSCFEVYKIKYIFLLLIHCEAESQLKAKQSLKRVDLILKFLLVQK